MLRIRIATGVLCYDMEVRFSMSIQRWKHFQIGFIRIAFLWIQEETGNTEIVKLDTKNIEINQEIKQNENDT